MRKVKHSLGRTNGFDVFNYLFLTVFSITIVFPFWDMIVRSLSDVRYSTSLTMMLWPKGLTLDSYRYVLSDDSILRAYLITILRTLSGTALSLLLVMLGAFPLSKRLLPGRKYITLFFLIPMFFSGGLIPSYLINRKLGLVNNFLVYILPGCVGVYNVVLARNFLMSLDTALEESAFIDGAGYLRVLLSIILPLSTPILATLTLWIAVGHWNAWFDCMVYIRTPSLEVVQMLLRRMQDLSQYQSEDIQSFMINDMSAQITSVSVRMATTIVTVLPIMCVYPFIQKYFVKGIMVGSLKG